MREQLTYHFDRLRWLEARGLLSCRIIFLDLNFWIGLTEGRNPKYVELRELLSSQVAEGQLVCTLTPSLLLELKKRPSSERRTNYCQLMDELSQGLSTRVWPVIFGEEFRSVIDGQPPVRQVAYSHFVEAMSNGLQVVFKNTWSEVDATKASGLIFDYLNEMSICEVVEVEVDEKQAGSIAFLRNGLSQLAQQEADWRKTKASDWKTVEQAEFAAVVRTVLPQIFSSATDLTRTSLLKLSTTSIGEERELLNQCPSFWCQYMLMTALRSNRTRISENDLWDLEHAASTLPYVDCLACDGGTRHLCSEVLKIDKKYGTTVLSNVADVIDWVNRVALPNTT